ncbi:MAG: DUF5005 domain-containing protein [Chitinophagales bacterium]|nr:DUF5005 domain-containing protein [Chitinophagales bacterium]
MKKRLRPLMYLFIVYFISTAAVMECSPDEPVCDNGFTDNKLENLFNRKCGWIAGDACYSLQLSNGNHIWMFGDSYVDQYDFSTGTVPCMFNTNNTMLYHLPNNYNDVFTLKGYFSVGGDMTSPVEWPGAAFETNSKAYVWVGSFNSSMQIQSQRLKYFNIDDVNTNGIINLPQYKDFNYSCGFVNKGDGYIYAYGTTSGFGASSYGLNALILARFPKTNVNSSAWRYWTGSSWSSNIADTKQLMYAVLPTVAKVGNKVVVISQDLNLNCNSAYHKIYAAYASNVTGPFSNSEPVYTVPSMYGSIPHYYSCVAHPEFVRNGKTLVTFCINEIGTNCHTCNGGFKPNLYRPKMVWLDLSGPTAGS